MSLSKDVRSVLELAEAYTLEAEVPRELKKAVHYCIARQWVRIRPVVGIVKLNPAEGGLFPDRRTVLIGPGTMPRRLLLNDAGELPLAEDRMGG
jgi:hypothetical protein